MPTVREWLINSVKDPSTAEQMTAWDYQTKALQDPSPRKVLCWGRRAGKTFTSVASIIWDVLTGGHNGYPPGRGFKILHLSPNKTMSEMVFEKIVDTLRVSGFEGHLIKRRISAPSKLVIKGCGDVESRCRFSCIG
jgi:hypothetical protein